jgi:hypothetical protein
MKAVAPNVSALPVGFAVPAMTPWSLMPIASTRLKMDRERARAGITGDETEIV